MAKKINNKKRKAKKRAPKAPLKIPFYKNIFFYMMVLFLVWIFVGIGDLDSISTKQLSLSETIQLIKEEKVQSITVINDLVEAQLKDGTKIVTEKESSVSFQEILDDNDIDLATLPGEYEVKHPILLMEILPSLLSFAIPILILLFIINRMKGANGDILSFGKSKARLFKKGKAKNTFDDVAGSEEAKKEVMEIVDFLKHPDKYRKLGARIPKGVLLVGPAGVGKTLMAKAIAGEAEVPFFSVAGSEFMEMLVGVGSARVRDLFKMAKETQPSLIFIDEVDAIGRQRGMGIGGGHDEREQTLNQILTEMDGFDPRTSVIVIAATNRPDMLDPALIRAGRFDRRVHIPLPDLEDRKKIIKLHMKGKPFTKDIDIVGLARKTVGFSGADIENMLNESAILAARGGKEKISDNDLDEAALKVTLGPERRTLQSEEERKMTAYHEAGHALVATNLPDMDKVQRISITARGASLGHTSFPPEKDRYNETKTRLESMLAALLGGRASEEVFFNQFTSGAANDIERATQIARKMVTEYGMSSLGPVAYIGSNEEKNWLAKQLGSSASQSEEFTAKIDREIKEIIERAYSRAKEILEGKKEVIKEVVEELLEKETLTREEFEALLNE